MFIELIAKWHYNSVTSDYHRYGHFPFGQLYNVHRNVDKSEN